MPPRRPVRAAGLTEAWLALPWLGWSYLSIVVVGNIPFDLSNGPAFWVIMTIWLGSGAAVWHPRTEELLARFVYRLRSLSELETRRIGPAWWAVCTAAGVDPNRYMVWIHDGPEATAPATAGHTVAVTSWSVYTLPPRNLEAVLAHELAHHLTLPPRLSLLILWYSLPARAMAVFLRKGLPAIRKVPVLGTLMMVVLGVLVAGMLIAIFFLGWPWHEAILLLSPAAAPLVIPLVSRVAEKFADRAAADLGYGVPLAQVFTGRAFDAARSGQKPERGGVTATQPPEAARLKALEAYLRSVPDNGHHPL